MSKTSIIVVSFSVFCNLGHGWTTCKSHQEIRSRCSSSPSQLRRDSFRSPWRDQTDSWEASPRSIYSGHDPRWLLCKFRISNLYGRCVQNWLDGLIVVIHLQSHKCTNMIFILLCPKGHPQTYYARLHDHIVRSLGNWSIWQSKQLPNPHVSASWRRFIFRRDEWISRESNEEA